MGRRERGIKGRVWMYVSTLYLCVVRQKHMVIANEEVRQCSGEDGKGYKGRVWMCFSTLYLCVVRHVKAHGHS